MKLITTLSRAAGLGLCVVAFSGTALADPGNGNGGPPSTPPGQEKKAETPAAAAPAPAPAQAPAPQAAQGQEKKAENAEQQAAKKAAPKPAAKPAPIQAAKPATAPGQAKKAEKQAEHKPAKAASESKGQSANAQHHVIVCHATGSTSNPYVVINIPLTAWNGGHSRHGDKLLKDPASRPGSKDGFDKAACGTPGPSSTQPQPSQTASSVTGCPASTTTTERVLVGVKHYTGAVKNGQRKFVVIRPSLKSAHLNGKHADDEPIYETRTVTRTASGENCATVTSTSNTSNTSDSSSSTQSSSQNSQSTASSVAGAQAPAGGVAGAVSPEQSAAGGVAGMVSPIVKKPKSKPAGGVLGAIASAPRAIAEIAASGTLPFTGLSLWMAALIGAALLLAGLTLRRRTAA